MKQKPVHILLLLVFLPFTVVIAPDIAISSGLSRQPPSGTGIQDITLKLFAEEFRKPLYLTNTGAGSRVVFVIEQAGRVFAVKGGTRIKEPFMDITDRVASGGEKGLLSITFHPEFKENGLIYANYTSKRSGRLETVVSEFKASEDRSSADTDSERVILRVRQPYGNHNGGQIAFGPDRMLYIGLGDGGSGNDPHEHGQNLNTLLGAILRIDINRNNDNDTRSYSVPPGNPFAGIPEARGEIWAYGFRNPWRFSFDPATRRLYVGDVGQSAREEIDIVEMGKNYGWNTMEGTICTPGVNPVCNKDGLEPPILDYGRKEGIAITGGYVYRGRKVSGLCGVYIYGDYGSGRIWGLRYDGSRITSHRLLMDTDLFISSFGIGGDNELYVIDHRKGRIYMIVESGYR